MRTKKGDDIIMLKVLFFVEFLLIKQMCGNTVCVNKNYKAIILFGLIAVLHVILLVFSSST